MELALCAGVALAGVAAAATFADFAAANASAYLHPLVKFRCNLRLSLICNHKWATFSFAYLKVKTAQVLNMICA